MKDALTPTQARVLEYLKDYHREYDNIPPSRQVARHFGIRQTAAVGHLRALARKGHIESIRTSGTYTFYRFARNGPAQTH